MMRKLLIVLIIVIAATAFQKATAQCSVCTRTAQQLGEKPAKGMNAGILYLAFAPFAICGYIYYRWKKDNAPDEEGASHS
jgi:hypothetical protein